MQEPTKKRYVHTPVHHIDRYLYLNVYLHVADGWLAGFCLIHLQATTSGATDSEDDDDYYSEVSAYIPLHHIDSRTI